MIKAIAHDTSDNTTDDEVSVKVDWDNADNTSPSVNVTSPEHPVSIKLKSPQTKFDIVTLTGTDKCGFKGSLEKISKKVLTVEPMV